MVIAKKNLFTVNLESANKIRDVLWQKVIDAVQDSQVQQALKILAEAMGDRQKDVSGIKDLKLNDAQLLQLANASVVMNAMYEFSWELHKERQGHTATILNNTIQALEEEGASVQDMMFHIQQNFMHDVGTMHPTYTATLEFSERMNALLESLTNDLANVENTLVVKGEAVSDNSNQLFEQLVDPGQTSLAVEGLLSVQDEVSYQEHIWHVARKGRKQQYKKMDAGFEGKEDYNPFELVLSIVMKTWVVGDKDGNNNITAEDTAKAVLRYRVMLLDAYKEDLTALLSADTQNDLGESQQQSVQAILQLVENRKKAIEGGDVARAYAPEEDIEAIAEIRKQVMELTKEIVASKDVSDDLRTEALSTYRSARDDGTAGIKMEYRDDKKHNREVIKQLVKAEDIQTILGKKVSYTDLSQEERFKVTQVLHDSSEANIKRVLGNNVVANRIESIQAIAASMPARVDTLLEELEGNEEAKKPGFDTDAKKAYHTLSRAKLMSKNGDMINQYIVAEAGTPLEYNGKMEDSFLEGDMMEVNFLTKITGIDPKNTLNVPLIETPEGLDHKRFIKALERYISIPSVYNDLARNAVGNWERQREKMPALPDLNKAKCGNVSIAEAMLALNPQDKEFAEKREAGNTAVYDASKGRFKITDILKFEVQWAQSDNLRRGSQTVSNGRIVNAVHNGGRLLMQLGMQLASYIGGSLGNMFRGGGQAAVDIMNKYLTAFLGFDKNTVQGMDLFKILSTAGTYANFGLGKLTHMMASKPIFIEDSKTFRAVNKEPFQTKEIREQLYFNERFIEEFAEDQYQHYINEMFTNKNTLGYVIAQIFNYKDSKLFGTIGSRVASKGGGKSSNDAYLDMVNDTRTIGFTDAFVHKYFDPNLFGAGVSKNTTAALIDKLQKKMPNAFDQKTYAAKKQYLYQHSNTFRDMVNRYANGAAFSDFDKIWGNALKQDVIRTDKDDLSQIEKVSELLKAKGIANYKERTEAQLRELAEAKEESPTGMLAFLELEMRAGAVFAYEALTGKELKNAESMTSKQLSDLVNQQLSPNTQQAIQVKKIGVELGEILYERAYKLETEKPGLFTKLGRAAHAIKDFFAYPKPNVYRDSQPEINKTVMVL